MISFAYRKYCNRNFLKDTQSTTNNHPNSRKERPVTRNGGRPKGTILLQKHHEKITAVSVKNEISTLYFEEKNRCKEKGEIVGNRWLKETIERVSQLRGLPKSIQIPLGTIRNCR